MRTFRHLTALAATGLLALTTGCVAGSDIGSSGGSDAGGGDITIAANVAWEGFNPYNPDDGNVAGLSIGNALYPSAFNVVPGQQTELNTDLLVSADVISEDPQVVEYVIQDDAVWSDGTPITAADFIYLWESLNGSNPDLQVTTTTGYEQISSVEAGANDKTVDVTFSTPYADWKGLFSMLLPAHYMEGLGDPATAWNDGLDTEPAPSGTAWTLSDQAPGEYLVFTRNDAWYGEPAKLNSMTVRAFGDDQSTIQALGSGEVDVSLDVRASRASIEQLQALPNVTTTISPTSNQQSLNIQFSDGKITTDPAVRQALAIMTQPEKLTETLFGDVSDVLVNNHIYAPNATAYKDNRPSGFATGDANAAKKVLTDAGWTEGSDGIMTKDGQRLELDFTVRAEDQVHAQLAQLLQAAYKDAGIQLSLRTVAPADWFATGSSANYDVSLGNSPASAFPVTWMTNFYTCDGGYNWARYCNEEVDALYKKALETLDETQREELVQQIDTILWDDVASIPLWVAPGLTAESERMNGVDPEMPKEYQYLEAAKWSVDG